MATRQTQGSQGWSKPSLGYDVVQIPKEWVDAQIVIGGVQTMPNQKMPAGMGTVMRNYVPQGRSTISGAGGGTSDPIPGKDFKGYGGGR